MPPKKQKVKVRKTSKSGGKGVNIKIVIDQSKKTKGVAPKATTAMRQLPAFSAMPQGASYLGASVPNRQDAPINISPNVDTTAIGDRVFNQLLAESNRLRQSASGFGGFQNAGQQLNQIFDGQYRAGRNNFPIISNPNESSTTRSIDYAVFDDPETNNQILGNKLNNRGSMLPDVNDNTIGALNEEERRDNALDNLVIQEKKSKATDEIEDALDEELLEEDLQNEEYVLQEIASPRAQEERAKEIALQGEEAQYIGRVATKKIRDILEGAYDLPDYPPAKKASIKELKDYINAMNREFKTNYDTSFKGRTAVDDLRRVIRVGLLKAYDDL
jgi:hypothetical protein